jgi:4'-phosphopantetheinyl transferase
VTGWLDALERRHEAHLWYVRPDEAVDERRLAPLYDLLSPAELERNGRFVFANGRREHLLTRALVRTTLSAYRPDVDPRAWQFIANPFGRPEIAAPTTVPRLCFNVSHTDGLIVCLVAVEREIGVDVEDTARAHLGTVEIADRFFSPAEVAELRSLPAWAQPDRFFDYWTLKEAYIKARGLGLHLPLDQFSFHLGAGAREPAPPIRISFGPEIADDPASWQFGLLDLTPRHRLATAIRRGPGQPDLTVRYLSADPLKTPPRR